ncbi:MAG: hypothetical protein GY696_29155 [Gammaproteobacteria bacterium]|nr:hypothetical protein [Gammaproteobacteria bacterium]
MAAMVVMVAMAEVAWSKAATAADTDEIISQAADIHKEIPEWPGSDS